MSIASEIIGRLGGVDVDSFPVEVTASGSSGSSVLLGTVEVPEGETWLVSVVGSVAAGVTSVGGLPSFRIGKYMSRREPGNQSVGLAAVVTETTDVELIRNTGINSDSFSGNVYTVKMEGD